MSVTLIHNPNCSKSNTTLALLRNQGVELTVIDYLSDPLTVEQLNDILQRLRLTPYEFIRKKEATYKLLELEGSSLPDEALVRIMVANPILIERPIILSNGKAIIGRPPERALTIL
ncbi:MAG: arsenate reductase (glutaredoxin) [Methylococcales bacterium]|nr:arsenate reductase (glutaredoxin) [Methylococcales bacterium]